MEKKNIEELLNLAASKSAFLPLLYRSILSSDLLVLTDKKSIEDGVEISNIGIEGSIACFNDGVIPVFSSEEKIYEEGFIKDKIESFKIRGIDLLEKTKGSTLVLNPFSKNKKELLPTEIELLLNGDLFKADNKEVIYENTNIRLGQPEYLPEEISSVIIDYSKTKDEINKVYVSLLDKDGTGENPSLLLAMDLFETNENEIFGELGFIIKPLLPEGKVVDFINISDYKSGISEYFDKIDPVYIK